MMRRCMHPRILVCLLCAISLMTSGCAVLSRSIDTPKTPESPQKVEKKKKPARTTRKKKEPAKPQITREYREMLDEAQDALDEFVYEIAAELSERVLRRYPNNQRAIDMRNVSHYQLAHFAREADDPISAISHLEKVSPGYEDRDALLLNLKKDTAQTLYLEGLAAYTNGDFAAAATEWRKALKLYPDHQLAKRDLARTTELLKKLDSIE